MKQKNNLKKHYHLYREVGFEAAYTYIYSPREGTPAAKMQDNVPMEVKKERLQRLNALVNESSAEAMKNMQGKVVEVLVEGESKNNPDVLAGYTRKSKLVNFIGTKNSYWQISKSKNYRNKNMVIKWRNGRRTSKS